MYKTSFPYQMLDIISSKSKILRDYEEEIFKSFDRISNIFFLSLLETLPKEVHSFCIELEYKVTGPEEQLNCYEGYFSLYETFSYLNEESILFFNKEREIIADWCEDDSTPENPIREYYAHAENIINHLDRIPALIWRWYDGSIDTNKYFICSRDLGWSTTRELPKKKHDNSI